MLSFKSLGLILIKNEIITTKNARKLIDSGKLEIENADEIIKKYE